jgi:MFS family permease
VIVVVSAVMPAIGAGVLVIGISVFFAPLHEEFGWQRGAVSLINFAGVMGLALGGIVMGRVADRTATRNVGVDEPEVSAPRAVTYRLEKWTAGRTLNRPCGRPLLA